MRRIRRDLVHGEAPLEFQELPNSLPHEGGSCTQVWKTRAKGPGAPKCPAHSRHKQSYRRKKTSVGVYGRLNAFSLVGLPHPAAGLAAAGGG